MATEPRISSRQALRVPPQHIEAEKALLGSVMIKPDSMHEVVDIVTPESFYVEKHRKVYQIMLELFSRSEPIDLLSLSSRLEEKNQLEQIGGRSFLAELVNTVPSAGNIKHYANLVEKKSMMRRLIEAADYLSELGYEETLDVEEMLDRAEKRVFDVTSTPTLHKFISLKETLGEAWERLEHLHQSKDELRGVRTGFGPLDDILAGFQKSDLIILAARPSMGKSALALDIARQTAVQYGTSVGIFSLEMSSQSIVDRMLASQSRVNAWKLRTGRLTSDSEFDQIRNSLDVLAKAPIFIDDQPGSNILKMRSVARRLKSEHGLGLIVVDYLQLMIPSTARAGDSQYQQVTEISRSLKTLARELDVPVLALSQLSRAVETRRGRPRLSDLRDSGSIEQDADVVMFIHRDDKMNEHSDRPNIAEILIEKHRNGPTGRVELYFDEQRATFLPVDKSSFGDLEDKEAAEDF